MNLNHTLVSDQSNITDTWGEKSTESYIFFKWCIKSLTASSSFHDEYHAAEGSDWFWWYGDDHFSIQADIFDKLFRTHLVNIYRLLKLNVPSELFTPIKAVKNSGVITKPSSLFFSG